MPETAIATQPYYTSYIPRIDPEEKRLWLEALDSEQYKDKQGRGVLQTHEGRFCCLGVYCDVKDEIGQFSYAHTYHHNFGPNTEITYIAYGDDTGNYSDFNWTEIPAKYGIKWAEPGSEDHRRLGEVFTGSEELFRCYDQGSKALYGEWYSTPVGYTLPGLNDTDFTFSQIRDIINYFL